MKKNSTIILMLAIISAFSFLSSCNQSGAQSGAASTSGAQFPVAYVNTDTLLEYYKYYDDIKAEFEADRGKISQQLEQRGSQLQQEVVSYQRMAQAGLMSNNDMKQRETTLMQKEQDLRAYQETVSAGLAEKEAELTNKLYDKMTAYIKEYNKTKGFKLVLTYTRGSAILFADQSLDITKEILDGLNAEYEKEKASAPTAKK